MLVGILGLQGGVIEHQHMLESLGAEARWVRRPGDLDGLDALILPGGESTTMNKLIDIFELREPLRNTIQSIPTLGTCAGLVLLSQMKLLDVDVDRNAFGPQVESLTATIPWRDGTVEAAFIRAPEVIRTGDGVEVTSVLTDSRGSDDSGHIVGVRQGDIIGIAFHPELTGDTSIHQELLDAVKARAK